MMDFIKKLFGKSTTTKVQSEPIQIGGKGNGIFEIDDPVFEKTYQARNTYWSQIGDIDNDVISYVISPQFMGKPHWPTARQAFKIIRTQDSLIIASDGLSDPLENSNMQLNGFECEVYIESKDLADKSFDEIKTSWQFYAVECLAQNIANNGGIKYDIEDYGVLSTELPTKNAPTDIITKEDYVGFLINCVEEERPHHIKDAPLSEIQILPIVLLLPEEIEYIVKNGHKARKEIATKLIQMGQTYISNPKRKSVIN